MTEYNYITITVEQRNGTDKTVSNIRSEVFTDAEQKDYINLLLQMLPEIALAVRERIPLLKRSLIEKEKHR